MVASARVPYVIPSILKVVGASERSLAEVSLVSIPLIRLVKRIVSPVLAVLIAGINPLNAVVTVVLALLKASIILLTLIKVVPTRVADTPIFLFSEIVILPLTVPLPSLEVLPVVVITSLIATPFFQKRIARLDTFLNSGVVRKHAPFGVFHSDLPIIEDLLLVHAPDSFVSRFARCEHNISKALR